MYRETRCTHLSWPVRDVVELLLRSTEPNPAFVHNRRGDILQANPQATSVSTPTPAEPIGAR